MEEGKNELIKDSDLVDIGMMVRPPSGATGDSLQKMVGELEHIERLLHSDDSPPPTITEHRLYGLIIRHVKLYTLMFYIERGSRFHQWLFSEKLSEPSDEKEELISLLLEVYCGKNSIIDRGCLSGEIGDQKIEHVWDLFIMFNGLLKKSRNHLSKLYSPPVASSMEIELEENRAKDFQGSSSGSEAKKWKDHEHDSINLREHCLMGILRGLEDIGRARSYAPPKDGEIQFYQEIRMRVTSYLEFMEAKPGWQSIIKKWYLVTRETQGTELWHSLYRGPSSYGVTYAPAGYRLATALDEFPDFLVILRECKCHFLEIYSWLSNGPKVTVDNVYTKGGKNKEAQGTIWFGTEERKRDTLICSSVLNPVDFERAAVKETEINKNTREQYLQDILTVFKKMGSLNFDSQLQVVETRLYAQIVEHVTSSIWMYNTLQGGKKMIEKKCDPIREPADAVYDFSDYSMFTTEGPVNREQCLIRIVQLVEAIRSSFLGAPSNRARDCPLQGDTNTTEHRLVESEVFWFRARRRIWRNV